MSREVATMDSVSGLRCMLELGDGSVWHYVLKSCLLVRSDYGLGQNVVFVELGDRAVTLLTP